MWFPPKNNRNSVDKFPLSTSGGGGDSVYIERRELCSSTLWIVHCGDDDDDGDHAGLENERMGDHVRWSSIDKSITAAAATEVGNYWQVNKFVWRLTKNARAYRRKMILFIDDDNVDGGGAASRSVSFVGMGLARITSRFMASIPYERFMAHGWWITTIRISCGMCVNCWPSGGVAGQQSPGF